MSYSGPIAMRISRTDSAHQIGAKTTDGVLLSCIDRQGGGDKWGELGGISLFLTLGEMLQCL